MGDFCFSSEPSWVLFFFYNKHVLFNRWGEFFFFNYKCKERQMAESAPANPEALVLRNACAVSFEQGSFCSVHSKDWLTG